MKRIAFLVGGLLVTAVIMTVFIIRAKMSRRAIGLALARWDKRFSNPPAPSVDLAEILSEEGVFDKLDNGLYIAILKDQNVSDNIFEDLCVAILKNVTDTAELVNLIGAGFKNTSRVRYFRHDENVTKIRGFIMDRHCSTSIVVP